MRIETLAVHAGRRVDPATKAVTPPIYLSTTFEREADGEYPAGFAYSREESPNRRMLEECLTALEGGKESLAFASGLAVLTAVVQGLEPGDHIVAPAVAYYGMKQVMKTVFAKWPVEATFVDMTDLDAIRSVMRPNTRLVWVETPSNPLLSITDMSAVAEIAQKANAITVADNTFATPLLQRPFDFGIDMVMHSTTKYIGGHSDLLGGSLTTKHDNYLFERVRNAQHYGGGVPSAFDCWLALRGASSLACRVRAHTENASAVAAFLHQHPKVERVHYPGLTSHPGHELAAKQMTGFGGMLSFQVNGCRDKAMGVAAAARVFTRATSLGGPHSYIEHRASIEGPTTKTPQNLLRCSIGLEHRDDLIADLDQALATV